MAKWADYCISKITLDGKSITDVIIHEDKENSVGGGENKDRNWLVQKANLGKTFCCIKKTKENQWAFVCNFYFENGGFKWDAKLPQVLTKRKTFVSYYHNDDQNYREYFENLFDDLIVSKSVEDGDIDSDNSDEYIKQLIQKDYLKDTTVLVVLVGAKTKCRKHIDWEISGAISSRIGGNSGLIGILLPSHPDYGTGKFYYDNLPKRLAKNVESGYAIIIDWTEDRKELQDFIETAYSRRSETEKIINKAIPQMDRNICD